MQRVVSLLTCLFTLVNMIAQTVGPSERIIGFKTTTDYHYNDNPIFNADSCRFFYSKHMSNYKSPFLNELCFPIDSIENYGPNWYVNYYQVRQNNNMDLIVNTSNPFKTNFSTLSFDSCVHYRSLGIKWTSDMYSLQTFNSHTISMTSITDCPAPACMPSESEVYLYNNTQYPTNFIYYNNYYDELPHWIYDTKFSYNEKHQVSQAEKALTTLNATLVPTTTSEFYYFNYDNYGNIVNRKFISDVSYFDWMDSMAYTSNKIKTYWHYYYHENNEKWRLDQKKEFSYNTYGVAQIVVTNLNYEDLDKNELDSNWDTTKINLYYNNVGQLDSIIYILPDNAGAYKNYFHYENGLITFYEFVHYLHHDQNVKVDFDYDESNFLIDEVYYNYHYDPNYPEYIVFGDYKSRTKTDKGNIKTYTKGHLTGLGASPLEAINDNTNEIQGRDDFYAVNLYYEDYIQLVTSDPNPVIAIHISPNPSSETFSVNITNADSLSKMQLNVFSASGQQMYALTSSDFTNGSISIDCKSWAPGIYIVKANDDFNASIEKIIIN